MPSAYLSGGDVAAFGAGSATTQQIQQASVLIDAYLRRPHGLIYTPDANGLPAFMSALNPELSFTLSADIAAGNGVQAQITGPVSALQVGDCVVIDRGQGTMESVQLTSLNGNAVTLGATQFAHTSGAKLETGLMITEKRYVPKNRSEVTLAYPPVMRIVGGSGRYAYGRRGDAANYNADNFNLLASLSKFGGPPAWEIWPANSQAGIDAATGMLWVPAGILLAYYSEVKVRYVAGFTYASLPDAIKLACAQLVQAASQNPQIFGSAKMMRAGDTAVEQFAATLFSDDVKVMLQPWRARAFG